MAFEWHNSAACRGYDPEIFFPDHANKATTEFAKAVCSGCPVRQRCLEGALERREQFGVWGGFSAPEIMTLLRNETRRKKRASHLIVRST